MRIASILIGATAISFALPVHAKPKAPAGFEATLPVLAPATRPADGSIFNANAA